MIANSPTANSGGFCLTEKTLQRLTNDEKTEISQSIYFLSLLFASNYVDEVDLYTNIEIQKAQTNTKPSKKNAGLIPAFLIYFIGGKQLSPPSGQHTIQPSPASVYISPTQQPFLSGRLPSPQTAKNPCQFTIR